MAKSFVVNVMARDRVGIVAGVTRAIDQCGGNVDAVSQTVLRGYFTLILTAQFPGGARVDDLRAAVEKAGTPGELAVSVKVQEREAVKPVVADGDEFVLSILGKDRPGVVTRISAYLCSRNINIVDLYAYTEGDEFMMLSQVTIPRHVDVRQIQIDLEGLPMGKDMEIRLQHQDVFAATNEIEFRHKEFRPKDRPC